MKKSLAVLALALCLSGCASFQSQSPLLQQAEKLSVYIVADLRIQGEIDDPAAQTAKMIAAHKAIDDAWTVLQTGKVSQALLNSVRDQLATQLTGIGIPAMDTQELATLLVAAILSYVPQPQPAVPPPAPPAVPPVSGAGVR